MALEVPAQLEKQLEVGASEQIDEEVLAEAAVRLGIVRRGRGRFRGPFHRDGIASAMEHQRRPVEVVERLHLADEDDVVAALIIEGRAALESRRAAAQQRDLPLATLKHEPGKLVGAPRGEGQ